MDIIKRILNGYTDVPITESSELINDLGLDSFLLVYFLTEVEEQFGIDLDEAEFTDFVTVGDILDRVKSGKR